MQVAPPATWMSLLPPCGSIAGVEAGEVEPLMCLAVHHVWGPELPSEPAILAPCVPNCWVLQGAGLVVHGCEEPFPNHGVPPHTLALGSAVMVWVEPQNVAGSPDLNSCSIVKLNLGPMFQSQPLQTDMPENRIVADWTHKCGT